MKENLYFNYHNKKKQIQSLYQTNINHLNEKYNQLNNLIKFSIEIKEHEISLQELTLYYDTKKRNLQNKINDYLSIIEMENKEFDNINITTENISEKSIPFLQLRTTNLLNTKFNSKMEEEYLMSFQNKSPEQQIKCINTNYKKTESEMMIRSFLVEEDLIMSLDAV